METPNKCELIETCGFFLNFRSHTEVVKQLTIDLYCNDLELSELCERKKIRKQTGEPPPDNMSPTGNLL